MQKVILSTTQNNLLTDENSFSAVIQSLVLKNVKIFLFYHAAFNVNIYAFNYNFAHLLHNQALVHLFIYFYF